MTPKNENIPSDQFERTKDELRKLNLMVEQIQHSIDIAHNINTYEARRSLAKAMDDIETAGFWLDKAVKVLTPKA